MNRPHTFGIVGGYGATGSAVVAEILKSCDGQILIGGRDLNQAKTAAAKFGSQATAAQLDGSWLLANDPENQSTGKLCSADNVGYTRQIEKCASR